MEWNGNVMKTWSISFGTYCMLYFAIALDSFSNSFLHGVDSTLAEACNI